MGASSAVKVVLLDIEGTVCPISFVKDVLFPYALEVLPETIKSKWDSSEFKGYREAFPPEYSSDQDAFQAHVVDLVTRDLKISYVKSLQGYLWEKGYESGDLKAPLFSDVPKKMSIWHGKGVKLMIYSSGSVPAQKLLFKHTNADPSDLSPLISDWFDTVNAGLKTEVASYKKIASKHPEFLVDQFLFLSDNVKEVDAAIQAGMRSVVVQRPGNADLSSEIYDRLPVVETFDTINDDFKVEKPQNLGKRDRSPEVGAETTHKQDDVPAETTQAEESHEAKRLKQASKEGEVVVEESTRGEHETR